MILACKDAHIAMTQVKQVKTSKAYKAYHSTQA